MLVARSGLSPVMVGRDAELDRLRRRFDAVGTAGPPPTVIVSGEAGVGKTRLLREFCSGLDAPVLAGHAEEGGLAGSFALVRSLLEPYAAAWEDRLPTDLLPREHVIRHVLSPLVSEPPPGEAHEHLAEEFLRAGVDVVAEVVGDTPTVVIFEDLHWADAESVALFARLATTPGLPALLIGTLRPEDFGRHHPLARVLPSLQRQRGVDEVSLGRLSAAELAALLEAVYDLPAPGATVQALHARTHGNPYFVEELVACCGIADPAELPDVELPWNAAEAVLRRVDDVDGDARRVLEVAAVLGSRVPFDLLAAVAGVDEPTLLAALHDLVARGLLAEADADEFTWRHALTREAVAGQLFGREVRRIHEAALDWLEEAGDGDVVALARHAAGARRSAALARYAEDGAVRLLAEGATVQALELAELALEEARELGAEQAAALHELASQAAWRLALADRAGRHARAWRQAAAELGDAAGQAAALRHTASVRWLDDDVEGYWQALADALVVAKGLGSSEELAWCYSYLSQAHMFDRNASEAIRWADRALEMAAEVGAEQVRPYTLVNKGSTLTELAGHEAEGLSLLAEAREEARRLGQPKALLRAYHNALVHLIHDAPGGADLARELLAEADAAADRYGHELFSRRAMSHGFHLALIDGDLAAAADELRGGPAGDAFGDGIRQLNRAIIAAERGDAEAARRRLAHPAAHADPGPQGMRGLRAYRASASVRVARGLADPALADEGLAELARPETRAGDEHRGNPSFLALAVIDGAALPDVDDAALSEVLEATRQLARPGRPLDEALAAHAEAAVAARRGDAAVAAARYREALARTDLPRPACYLADAHTGLARLLAASGSRGQAREHVEVALGLLERWPGWRREEIAALGRKLARGGQAGGWGLTPREREVLALVAEGASNREIAERLVIAQKTVAVHVSNILAKAGASSRTEAAARARRDGLLDEAAGAAR